MEKSLSLLHHRIHYTFQNEALCLQALSHRSHGYMNNERLEFLGDAVLNLVVTEYLFHQFSHAKEGTLSRLRARLVKGEHLTACANAIGLSDFLRLGQGEMKSGGYRRDSILENAFEALIGAIYLDGGLEAVRRVIHNCFESSLSTLTLESSLVDAKTRLQEHCQKFGYKLPEYEILSIIGAPHDQIFSVLCHVKEKNLIGNGQAFSRKSSEQKAAEDVLKQLGLM